MSVIETISRDKQLEELGESLGQFKAYSNDLPIAEIVGTRVVKCLYQVITKEGPNKGKKSGENSYVRITTKHLTEERIVEQIATLTPYILAYLQAEEDKIIKSEHKKGCLSIYQDSLSLARIVEVLEATSESARLTKDKIEQWFGEHIMEPLALLIIDKMDLITNPTSEQEAKIHVTVNAYRTKFTSLASPKTILLEADRSALINVITKCEAQDSLLGARFITKIEGMVAKKQEELLEL